MRNIFKILAMTAVALAGIVAPATTAQADATGCTQLGSWKTDSICVDVRGKGTYVNYASVYIHAQLGYPCNIRLYITFFDLKGAKYSQSASATHDGCYGFKGHQQTYKANMREGRACGAVSVNGVMKPGACVNIRK